MSEERETELILCKFLGANEASPMWWTRPGPFNVEMKGKDG